MTDKKISELGNITQGDIASGDWIAVVDSSENATKKFDFSVVIAATNSFDDVTAFFASTDTYAADTIVETRAEGFAYKAVDTATATTVANAGGQNFEVLPGADSRLSPLMMGITETGSADNDALWQKLIDRRLPINIPLPSFAWEVGEWTIPPDHPGIFGASMMTKIRIKHRAGATGQLVKWNGTARVIGFRMQGLYFEGNGEAGETDGLDFTGFSYCHFENLYVRLFTRHGIFADGSITPIVQQFSNNTFLNVRSNNNSGDGMHWAAAAAAENENTTNTFLGCETSGNAGRGVYEAESDSNRYYGHTSQGNATDFETAGGRGTFEGYTEGNPKSVILAAKSNGWDFKIRSTYPLWNSFSDSGTANSLSVQGEIAPERHVFQNPLFASWGTALPTGISLAGSPAVTSYVDTGSPAGAGLQITTSADLQGLVFSLSEGKTFLQGKWVTLLLEVDTSGVVDPLVTRTYSKDGGTLNSGAGQFAVEALPITAAGQFKALAYDVRFAASVSGTPTVVWYSPYSGNSVGGNVIKIRSARIVLGQTQKAGFPNIPHATPSLAASSLSNASNGINIHRKTPGRTVYDQTSGKLRFALAGNPTSSWRATDGSGDLTPS